MPFLDHLEELRWRLAKMAGALAITVGVAFGVLVSGSFDVIGWLARPVTQYLPRGHLIVTGPSDSFNIILDVAIFGGVLLASPVIVWQVWGFLSPAMYKHEKKVVVPMLVGAAALFVAGMALAFYAVVPASLKFLMGIGAGQSIENMMTVDNYFGFLFGMCVTFGIVFELPIVILLLTAFGLVTPAFLSKYRRHAFVACLVAAALITPGQDPTSLFLLTLPLYVLYELSILLSFVVFRKRQKRVAAQEAQEALEARDAMEAIG